ncbi:MAG: MoaD/ThiS family protein [Spirochaetales bacterium]|nr:MoaD/ThiS family protein [Spirochaetales bacterium]
MEITVKLFASLRKERFNFETKEFIQGASVSNVIDELNIPENKVSIIFVNNRHADLKYELVDGDVLALFPPVGGG